MSGVLEGEALWIRIVLVGTIRLTGSGASVAQTVLA